VGEHHGDQGGVEVEGGPSEDEFLVGEGGERPSEDAEGDGDEEPEGEEDDVLVLEAHCVEEGVLPSL
jgi:hypothetical protein